jgi:diguanylate cyclase (GGDEF)-like protein/PAS domain S-box-containing protein
MRTPTAHINLPIPAQLPQQTGRETASVWEISLFLLGTACFAGYLAWVGFAGMGGNAAPRVPIVTQALLAALSILGAALSAMVSTRIPDRATRRAWVFFGIALIATGVVSMAWVYRLASGSAAAGPLALQLTAAAYDVFLLAALVTFPVRRMDSRDRSTFWFDGAIVAGVAALLTWHLLLRAALVAAGSDWHTSIYALAYPVADVVLLFAAVVLLLRRPLQGSLLSIRIIAATILLNTAADLLYMWAYIAHESQGDRLFYVAWAVVAWMATAAVFAQCQNVQSDSESIHITSHEQRTNPQSLIPYLAIAAIYATLIVEAFRSEARAAAAALSSGHTSSFASDYPVTTIVVGAMVVTAIVIVRQVAAQRRNAELVRERLAREAHFRALVQHSSDMVLVLEADGTVREASPAVARVLGHAPRKVVGRTFWDFFVADDMAVVQADIAQAIAAGDGEVTASGPCEWRIRAANGSERWVEAICTNLLDDPIVMGLVINGRDVSERKQLEAELTHRAYHDTLTGLVNRTRFRAKIVEAIARTTSGTRSDDGRSGLAVLYIDLDGFKAVNDIFGHDAGDRVLAAIADRLRDATRGSDTAARLGGDEFAILLERLRDADEVRMVAKRVLHLVRGPIRIDHRDVVVGASIGIVCASLGDTNRESPLVVDPDALLHNADSAMYAAKARGRGNYEFFVPTAGEAV